MGGWLFPAIASSVRFAVLSSCRPNRAHLGSSGRNTGIAGAICPEPFPCPGRLRVPAGLCKCSEKAAGLPGSNLSPSPAAPLKGRSLILFTKPDSRGARLEKLGCWLGSAPSSSRFQSPACLSQVGREQGSQSPPTEAKSRISPDFDGQAVYSRRAALAASPNHPFFLPGEVRALRCSITGISMATDLDITGVGNSTRDSDFIVPLKLCRAGTRSGDLPKPRKPRVLTKLR